MTAPERFAEKSDSLLHRGRRPYMTHSCRRAAYLVAMHGIAYSNMVGFGFSGLKEVP